MKKALLTFILLLTAFAASCQAQKDPLTGKRIAFIGDSYVYNHHEPQTNTWHYKFAKKHGMVYLNYGRNGTCIAIDRKGTHDEAIYKRATKMSDSLDYIVVIAGHNDANRIPPYVTKPDTISEELLRSRLALLCDTLISKYPKAGIFFFTPWPNPDKPNMERVIDIIKQVAGSRAIPVFDSRMSGIHVCNPAFRKLYFQKPDDTAHLNARGHDLFLPIAEEFLLRYMNVKN